MNHLLNNLQKPMEKFLTIKEFTKEINKRGYPYKRVTVNSWITKKIIKHKNVAFTLTHRSRYLIPESELEKFPNV